MSEQQEQTLQNTNEKDYLTIKQVRQILSAYNTYKPIENKICIDIPITPRGADNKMSVEQFGELIRFYAYYHVFSVQEAKLRNNSTDKKIDVTINEMKQQMIKEYNAKRNYKTCTFYKKCNPFQGYEQVFQKLINEEINNKKSLVNPEMLVSANECKESLNYPTDRMVKATSDLLIKNVSENNKESELFCAKKFNKIVYLYRHIMKIEKTVFLQQQIESLSPNDKKAKQEILKQLVKEFAKIFDKYIKDVVVDEKQKKETPANNETNKFLTLTWHAFSTLQDMKCEENENAATLNIKVRDVFKNFSKKLNKYQKLYYNKQVIEPVFASIIEKFDTINAYTKSKKDTELFLTNKPVIELEYRIDYKEVENQQPKKKVVQKKPAEQTEKKQKQPKAKKEKKVVANE